MKLFLTGFLQVFFVAVNTYFVVNKMLFGTAVAGFIVSFIWTLNVKKVAFGGMEDRILYASGAGFGSLLGLISSIYLF